MFALMRRFLFMLPPERAHDLALGGLDLAERLRLTRLLPARITDERELMGLRFPNAVGLSAGLDKDGDHLKGLAALGFGFIEIGTVTPRPQPGNPAPRLFRLPRYQALINRLGFNNKGLEHLCAQVREQRQAIDIPLGINIGKNRDTPVSSARSDYLCALQAVYPLADYIVVNLSSPNTPGLRDLQAVTELDELTQALKARQFELAEAQGRYVPLLVKVAPDVADADLRAMLDVLLANGIDGVTATNTTIERSAVADDPRSGEAGGLSGAPVRERSTEVIQLIREHVGPDYPIIGVGGILSAEDAVDKMRAGADLVQLYTGLIYKGPGLIRDTARAIAEQHPA